MRRVVVAESGQSSAARGGRRSGLEQRHPQRRDHARHVILHRPAGLDDEARQRSTWVSASIQSAAVSAVQPARSRRAAGELTREHLEAGMQLLQAALPRGARVSSPEVAAADNARATGSTTGR